MRIVLPGELYYRLIESYGFERDGGERSILWSDPRYFPQPGGQAGKMLDEAFDRYTSTKGVIYGSRLDGGTFLKRTSHGRVFVVQPLAGGELREASINDPSEWWRGAWIVTDGLVNREGVLGPSDKGFLVTNIGQYSTALFPDKSSEVLAGPEHNAHGGRAFVWMGDITQSRVLDAVLGHVPDEYQRWARTVINSFIV
jgi:hypothetical protein